MKSFKKNLAYFSLSLLFSTITGVYIINYYFKINISNLVMGGNVFTAEYSSYYKDDRSSGLQTFKPHSIIFNKKPGVFEQRTKVNTLGYADKEFAFSKDNCNVLVVGDSFVASHQVPIEKKFFRILENRLEKTFDKKIAIHATGMDGTSIVHQMAHLERMINIFNTKFNYFIFPIISNDIRDTHSLLDIAIWNRYFKDSDFKFPINWRTAVHGGINEPFQVIHPKQDHGKMYTLYSLDETLHWSDQYKLGIESLIKKQFISRQSVGERYLSGKYKNLGIEGYFGLSNLEPFWKKMIESYDFAVDLAVTKYNLNSQNTTAFETHSLIHYNRYSDKGFDHQRLVNQAMKPWIKRNINIASVLNNKNNLGVDDFHIIGDGHLSIEGHLNVANILYDQIGHKIIKSCNQ